MVDAFGPTHTKARFTGLRVYRTTVWKQPRFPRLVALRSSCGHLLGVGYVWRHQGYVAWRSCRG